MPGAKDPQGRKWLLTINNPKDKNLNHQRIKEISNICLTWQYPDIQYNSPATYAALLRRIGKVIRYSAPGQYEEYGTTEYMENSFVNNSRR